MKTLRQIISEIDFNDRKIQTTPDWGELSNVFDIYDCPWSDDTKLKAYHVKTWLCTDSWVGWVAYFLDGEFVCLSDQSSRKGGVDFEFKSTESAKKLEKYIRSLIEDENETRVAILDLDEEFEDTYKIEYNSQILNKTAIYNNEKVSIIKTNYPYSDKERVYHTVEIELADKSKVEVDCRELRFEYNTLN